MIRNYSAIGGNSQFRSFFPLLPKVGGKAEVALLPALGGLGKTR
ncbi:MAG: hypothetical protein AAFX53_16010 [Bacteroidota bacterium]